MNPLVSVIMPCYNSESTLFHSIASVLSQTYRPLEIIVVDDGSVDGSVKIARSFGDPVVVVTKENSGPATARNCGIKSSSGEYIAFLDSDDLWLPEKIERQVMIACYACEPALIFTGVQRTTGNQAGVTGFPHYKLYCGRLPISYPTLWENNCITTSSVLGHRSLFDDFLFDEDPLMQGAEDFDLWLRIADRHPIHYLNEVLTVYLVCCTGHSRSNLERTYLALNRMYDKHAAISQRHNISRSHLIRKKFELDKIFGIRFFQAGDIHMAKRYFARTRSVSVLDWSVTLYCILSFLPKSYISFLRKFKNQVLGVVNGIFVRHC